MKLDIFTPRRALKLYYCPLPLTVKQILNKLIQNHKKHLNLSLLNHGQSFNSSHLLFLVLTLSG